MPTGVSCRCCCRIVGYSDAAGEPKPSPERRIPPVRRSALPAANARVRVGGCRAVWTGPSDYGRHCTEIGRFGGPSPRSYDGCPGDTAGREEPSVVGLQRESRSFHDLDGVEQALGG